MATKQTIDIIWNGTGGQLDSVRVTVVDDNTRTVSDALIALIRGNVITAGDTFEIREVQP